MRTLSIVSSGVLALTLAGASAATVPGSNGKLAYFSAAEIFVVGSDGANARSLGAGLSPAWSPNGRRLAFDAATNGNYDVWTMRADGRDRQRVTLNPAPDYFASWSPDGTQIVFTSDRGGEDLFVIEADGRDERQLTTDPAPDWGPAWSPDGTRIAFAGNARGNLEVEVVNADGTGRLALTNDPDRDYDPAWSPDGTRIAFTSERDGDANVYVMNADGSGATRLTDDPAGDYRPAWSPDGSLIAFESDRDPAVSDRDVYVMNADGSEQHRLRSGDANARDVDWQPTVDLVLTAFETDRSRFRRLRGLTFSVDALSPGATRLDQARITIRLSGPAELVAAPRCRRRPVLVCAVSRGPQAWAAGVVVRRLRPGVIRAAATVSGWHVDPKPANNRAVLRVTR
jgi:dipeptidyl aminopeptidase/acylaminoacyl peptidase